MNPLEVYTKQFAYYRHLGEAAMRQLADDDLFIDRPAGTNSIAIIVKHLSGNMRSRWTDLLTTDGEKTWRNREHEFVADTKDRAVLEQWWATGWAVLEQTLRGLQPTDLDRIIYIRNEGHTVHEALNRQLAHYAYHVGQIVLLAKQAKGAAWASLSIPVGESERFNTRKFAKVKAVKHYTDDLMG